MGSVGGGGGVLGVGVRESLSSGMQGSRFILYIYIYIYNWVSILGF